MNRRRGSLAGSPLLIGAVTALIAVVAVYISYNANHGLPFTPTYNIRVQLPSAANLFPGNDVRIGGTRVGLVEKLVPEEQENGHVVVYAYLKLEKSVQPLPADTTATVPSISSIGLKYLALERGTSSRTIPAGERSQSHRPTNRSTSANSSTCSISPPAWPARAISMNSAPAWPGGALNSTKRLGC